MNRADASDIESMAVRFLRPHRAALEECRAIAGKTRNPQVLWERLGDRGVIPGDWVSDPRWSFARRGRTPVSNLTVRTTPTNAGAAVALASDVEGVLTVEQLVAEADRAVSAWVPSRPSPLLWRIEPVGSVWFPQDSIGLDLALTALTMADRADQAPVYGTWSMFQRSMFSRAGWSRPGWSRVPLSHIDRFGQVWAYRQRWMAAVLRDAVVPPVSLMGVKAACSGQPFAALRCPFELMIEVASLGYVLERIGGPQGSVVFCPAP